MKTLLILLVISSLALTANKRPVRIWDMEQLGIFSNTNICYTSEVQKLIDSAYNLPGLTIFHFKKGGTYHFSTFTNLTKGRERTWWWYKFPEEKMAIIPCDAPSRYPISPENQQLKSSK